MNFAPRRDWKNSPFEPFVTLCVIWYHLYNLKSVETTYGGVLLLVKLQASASFFRSTCFFIAPLLGIHLCKYPLVLKSLIDSGSPYVIFLCYKFCHLSNLLILVFNYSEISIIPWFLEPTFLKLSF